MTGRPASRLGRLARIALLALALAALAGPTPSAPAATFSKRIIGYFVQWAVYARDYEPADIPADKLTHVNYAFLAVNAATGQLFSIDAYADFQKAFPAKNGLPAQTWDQSAANAAGNFGRLRDLKALYPDLKVLVSVGGWTLSTPFPTVAGSETLRAAFAASCADWVSAQGLDGIDIDWEYPGTDDKANFTALVAATRAALDAKGQADGKAYLLTLAAPAAASRIAAWDLPALAAAVDGINLMTYDYNGGWQDVTGHVAPLYDNPAGPCLDPCTSTATWNVDWAVGAYLEAGVPAAKLAMGIPFYGRSWETVPATDNGLFQPGVAGPSQGTGGNWESGVFDYWKVVELAAASGYTASTDPLSQAPSLYGPNITSGRTTGGLFVTYESTASLAKKLAQVQGRGLGGVMFWELSGDVRDAADASSLLGLMARTFGGGSASGKAQPWQLLLLAPAS
ncbi:MAG: glycoside hydrolase family 18 protein [Solidesulfovibrio sp. DCME]|uniref:glycoside hydrolase family 18 protein n=1 Tax=Solidesulfovibrio sp. DCME TaxID=3447380 RepID=UPI003D110D84